jgi:hypothetical protein
MWAEIIKDILQSPVIAAGVVGLFTLLSIRLGLSRFRSERWWERKAEAYAAVIEQLHAMYEFSKAHIEAFEGEYEFNNFPENWRKRIIKENNEGWAGIRKAASIGSFVMTKRAASTLTDLIASHDKISVDGPEHEYHQARLALLNEAIIALKVEAKNDLRT